jgi:L-asparaginase
MKTILVVFTGGTIGSTANSGIINTADSVAFKLLEQFQQRYSQHLQVQFKTIKPMQVLSENLAPAAWTILLEAIEAENPGQFDGIIITHGTDTLAYTAAAISFYFHGLNRPILLVSSNYPLDNPKANGLENFICAVEFIQQINQPGVFVPYRNPGQITQLHRGNWLMPSLPLSGDFFSIQNRSYLQFVNNHFLNGSGQSVSDQANQPTEVKPGASFSLRPLFSRRILLLRPYPGLDYSHIDLNGVEAVLHDLYHSGTACSSKEWGGQLSLIDFIERCLMRGVQVYLAPAFNSGHTYDSTHALLAAGARMIWNMSLESAYVKLLLAYGNYQEQAQISKFIDANVAGELIELSRN